jgi:hypothetical protein
VFLCNLASANLFCVARPASADSHLREKEMQLRIYLFRECRRFIKEPEEMHYLFWIIWVRAPRQPIYSSFSSLSHIRL